MRKTGANSNPSWTSHTSKYNDDDENLLTPGEGSRLDELLEEKFKYSLELADEDEDDLGDAGLLDEDEELNDETFGGPSEGNIGTDFDFSAPKMYSSDFFNLPSVPTQVAKKADSSKVEHREESSSQNMLRSTAFANEGNNKFVPQPSAAPKMASLEEIEAQILASRQQVQANITQSYANSHVPYPSGIQVRGAADKRIMSVTEIEDSIIRQKQLHQQQQQQTQHQQPQPQLRPTNIVQGMPPQFHPNYLPGFPAPQQLPQMYANNQHINQFQPPIGGFINMPPQRQLQSPGSPSVHGSQQPVFNATQRVYQNNTTDPNRVSQMGPLLQNHTFGDNQQFNIMVSNGRPNGAFGAAPSTVYQPQAPLTEIIPRDHLQDQSVQHQDHMLNEPPVQAMRGSGRGEYGQMRYNTVRAQVNKKNVLLHTGFSNDENSQRGPSGKGPGPFEGGWSQQSNRIPRWIRYSNSMTQYEKETIAKIQIAQLVSDSPLRDDFYYQVYTQYKTGSDLAVSGANWQQSMLQGKDSSAEMQSQIKKLIESKKMKQKGTTLALEGALGKISLTSVRNPRQLIQIDRSAERPHAVPTFSRLTRRKILKSIEKVYTCILNLDNLKRTAPSPDSNDFESWNSDMERNINEMYEELGLAENIPFTLPHPFPYFLSYSKGKRAFPRLAAYLLPEQMFTALTALFSRAESLDVCNMPAGTHNEAIDLFVSTVIPTMVSFVSEVPLQAVIAFLRTLFERHNMVWLAKSKAGLAFLAMLLSRAEILKQGGGAQQGLRPPDRDDLSLWSELYNFLFASLQGYFAAIFPSSGTDGKGDAQVHDEVYVWQFLAAMAVGAAGVDHQRVLLMEVRDKIFETSRRTSGSNDPEDVKTLANVNLFLNALGLVGIDASQLASMQQ
ncbi:Protein PAT1 1 [Entophlyctis luteolus]|nr:Protein PAT1 1 [Entophlyctis luteolus]